MSALQIKRGMQAQADLEVLKEGEQLVDLTNRLLYIGTGGTLPGDRFLVGATSVYDFLTVLGMLTDTTTVKYRGDYMRINFPASPTTKETITYVFDGGDQTDISAYIEIARSYNDTVSLKAASFVVDPDDGMNHHYRVTAANVAVYIPDTLPVGHKFQVSCGENTSFEEGDVVIIPPFLMTVRTTESGSASDRFVLPLRSGRAYDFEIDWGDGTTDTITSWNQAELNHQYLAPGDYQLAITGVCEAVYFNYAGDRQKVLSVEQLGECGWNSFEKMFYGCDKMVAFNGSKTNISAVTSADNMFSFCSLLAEITETGTWNTGNITTFYYMFTECVSLLAPPDTAGWDTSKAVILERMFNNCNSMTAPPNMRDWDLTSASNIRMLFRQCTSLLTPPDTSILDVSNVVDASYMFYSCSNLASAPDVSAWNLTSMDGLDFMFSDCSAMATTPDVAAWNMSNVTKINNLFKNCSSLTVTPDVSLWNTANIVNAYGIFDNCAALTVPPAVGTWDTAKIGSLGSTFRNCPGLGNVPIGNWNMASCTNGTDFMAGANNALDTAEYDAFLINAQALPVPNSFVSWHFGDAKYTAGGAAEAARTALTDGSTSAWAITDGGPI